MTEMINRPNEHESEEDLLKLQQEFLKSNQTAAASVKRVKNPPIVISSSPLASVTEGLNPSLPKKKSLFSASFSQGKKNTPEIVLTDALPENKILFQVRESQTIVPDFKDFVKLDSGFPQVFHRSERTFLPMKPQSFKTRNTFPIPVNLPEAIGIHEKNIGDLENMTSEEKEEAHQEIVNRLSPETIAFLKKKTAKINQVQVTEKEKISETPLEDDGSHVSEFIKKYVPLQRIESDKLEWMRNSKFLNTVIKDPEDVIRQTLDAIRFDFHGREMDQSQDYSAHLGLHHHSEQSQAGYNLKDLLHLSRSTFPAQRSLAINVLSNLVRNLKSGSSIQSKNMKIIKYFVEQLSVLLCFRIALDDTHSTVVQSGIAALMKYFEENINIKNVLLPSGEQIWDNIALISSCSYALSRESVLRTQLLAKTTSTGLTQDEFIFQEKEIGAYSIQEIRNILVMDPILGLYASNMFVRMIFLLKSSHGVDYQLSASILIILCFSARHSSFLVKKLLSMDLINILERLLDQTVPFTSTSMHSSHLAYLSIKLIRLLAQPRREFCLQICKLDVFSLVSRYLTYPSSAHHETARHSLSLIKTEIFHLLTIMSEYKIDSHVFDDYRQLFVECMKMFMTESGSLISFSVLIKYLITVSKNYPHEMRIGSQNDALRPFVTLSMEHLGNIASSFHNDEAASNFVIQALRFKSIYISMIKSSNCVLCVENHQIMEPIVLSNILKMVSSVNGIPLIVPGYQSYDFGFWYDKNIDAARTVTQRSTSSALLASYIDLIYHLSLFSPISLESLTSIIKAGHVNKVIQSIITDPIIRNARGTLLHFCMSGLNELVNRWFKVMRHLIHEGYVHDEETVRLVQLAVSWLINNLLPGDELLVKELLDYLIDNIKQKPFKNCEEKNAWKHVKEIYYMNAFDERSLAISQSMHGLRDKECLMMEGGRCVSLPMTRDWLFLPISTISDEAKLTPNSSGVRVLIDVEGKEVETHNGYIVQVMLELITNLNLNEMITEVSERFMIHLMEIYLLPCLKMPEECEIFRFGDIEETIAKLLKVLTQNIFSKKVLSNGVHPLELAAGGQAVFYKLYRDMVHQYASVSFGNKTFGRILLLPLAMCFVSDYRTMFWTELIEYVKGFTHVIDDLNLESFDQFVGIQERNVEILKMYAHALVNENITAERNPFLFTLCSTQIGNYLKLGEKVEGVQQIQTILGSIFHKI